MATVDEIPTAHTPPGGYRGDMPAPVLGGCDEPLADGAPDLRGVWKVVHLERVHQARPGGILESTATAALDLVHQDAQAVARQERRRQKGRQTQLDGTLERGALALHT